MSAPARGAVTTLRRARPLGYFVHHQGRGHAERAAALIGALPPGRAVHVFCARPEVLPPLPPRARVHEIPSLFEMRGDETPMDHVPQPDTVHCAPLGHPAIREGMGAIAAWMRAEDPALIVCDVSAEVAQLARLLSVPHVCVLQHGERTDPGHRAAFAGAAGLLAPCDAALAQPDWAPFAPRIHYAPGLGLGAPLPPRAAARARLGIGAHEEVVVAMAGAGGGGLHLASLALGARATPGARWIALGEADAVWHATPPANLSHVGWIADPRDHLAAADVLVTTAGNTTCQMALAAGRPWVVIPEWCYFDEQACKADALARAGLAVRTHAPASVAAWRAALDAARAAHDPAAQRAAVRPDAARDAAAWLDALASDLWRGAGRPAPLALAGE